MKWELGDSKSQYLGMFEKDVMSFTYRLWLSREHPEYEWDKYKTVIYHQGEELSDSGWLPIPIGASQKDIEAKADLFIRQFLITLFP